MNEEERKIINNRLNAAITADQPKMSDSQIIENSLTPEERALIMANRKAAEDALHPTLEVTTELDATTGKPKVAAEYVNKDASMTIDAGLENDKISAGIKVRF